jgi:creatinine amidohydrolase
MNKKLRTGILAGILLAAAALMMGFSPASERRDKAVRLENLTWPEAEKALKGCDVVLFAVGARSKEHGPHLPLKTDYIMAEYLADRVGREVPVAILPTLEYGYYPSFLEYPGSVSIGAETFKNTIVDICRSMSGYGVRRSYVLNTGISTLHALKAASEELEKEGLLMRYLNLLETDKLLPPGLLRQEGGTHADEGETSMMLYIAPELVDMSKAAKDYDPRPDRKGLTRDPKGTGTYSPTGVWGDPTLATKDKGRVIVETTVAEIVRQVRELVHSPGRASTRVDALGP